MLEGNERQQGRKHESGREKTLKGCSAPTSAPSSLPQALHNNTTLLHEGRPNHDTCLTSSTAVALEEALQDIMSSLRMGVRHCCLSQVPLSNEGLCRGTGVESVWDTAWCKQTLLCRQASTKKPKAEHGQDRDLFHCQTICSWWPAGMSWRQNFCNLPSCLSPLGSYDNFYLQLPCRQDEESHRRRNSRKLKGFLTLQGDLLI